MHVLQFKETSHSIIIALNEPETEVTHELWFKTQDSGCGLFSITDNSGGGHDRHLYLFGGNLKTRIWNHEVIATSSLNLADNQWHHIAHTFGASIGGQKLYVDGILQASGTKALSNFNWQTQIRLGYSVDAPSYYFSGELAEVRIWTKTRTENEIQTTMTNRLTGQEADLLAYLPLSEGSGDSIKEWISGNDISVDRNRWTTTPDFLSPELSSLDNKLNCPGVRVME